MNQIEPTASYGKLFIDERHGYIGVGRSKKYNPKKCVWYNLADVENPALYCTNPRMDWKHRVQVDCRFECEIPSQGVKIDKIIRSGIYCQHHPHALNSQYEEWSEPGSIAIIRGIITQAYINTTKSEVEIWGERLRFVRESLLEQAICGFFLPNEFSKKDIEERYTLLSKAFEGTPTTSLIDKYYKILMEAS